MLGVLATGVGYVADGGAGSAATPRASVAAAEDATQAASAAQARVTPGFEIRREVHRLPAGSGTGRRVVFSESEQRVWLVAAGGEVVRTHPASGSVYDNLFPGTYEVFSRSRHATAFDLASTMEYFVRFTHGTGGSAIGFHDIPVSDGQPVQTVGQLGTPLSHGCIRQERDDAIVLWKFASVGTTVVVTP